MSSAGSNNASSPREKSGTDDPLIDSNLVSSNPGSYEDLHKKTKGNCLYSKITSMTCNWNIAL